MPVVAIDGPSGSGKSSVSREVASRLGLRYLDTGAMYRAVTWAVLNAAIDPADAEAVAKLAGSLPLSMPTDPADQTLVVTGVEITTQIRGEQVTAAVSQIATNLAVRQEMAQQQRAIIADAVEHGRGIVVEGRDITTVIAPDADVRILLTASEQARLARRAQQVHGHAQDGALEQVRDAVLRRDADDSTVSTFHTAADGVVQLDSSALDFDQTVQAVLDVIATQMEQSPQLDEIVLAEPNRTNP